MPNKGWLYPSMLRGGIRAGNTKQSSSAREVHENTCIWLRKRMWSEENGDLGLTFKEVQL